MTALTPEDLAAKREAKEAWLADRARLVFLHPMVASLALQLELVPVVDEQLPTAATDGRAVYVNAHWLKTLDPDGRVFLLAHEVWHNALLHFRRGKGRDELRWNLAVDHEVNGLLLRDGFKPLPDAVFYEHWKDAGAEEVYALLGDPAARRAAGLDEDGFVQRPKSADVHLGTERSHAAQQAEWPKEFGPIAGKRDPDYPGRMDPLTAEEWAERMVALGRQLRGDMPGELRRAVNAVTKPGVPWQSVLRDFLERSTGGGTSWIPPARRHVHRGLYLPSRQHELLRVAVALDTSGSTEHDLPRFLSELQRIVRGFGRYELRLLQCDAAVASDELYDEARPLPAKVAILGGGGTDFRPVFERLAADPPSALIFFTDGEGFSPERPPPWPVLWVLTPGGRHLAGWGRVLKLDRVAGAPGEE
jgi:predicted metal-dependent peptidase